MNDNEKPIDKPISKSFHEKCPECKGELQYNAFWGYSYCPSCKWCDWNEPEDKVQEDII